MGNKGEKFDFISVSGLQIILNDMSECIMGRTNTGTVESFLFALLLH